MKRKRKIKFLVKFTIWFHTEIERKRFLHTHAHLDNSFGNRKKLIFGHRWWVLLQPDIEHVFPFRPPNGASTESSSEKWLISTTFYSNENNNLLLSLFYLNKREKKIQQKKLIQRMNRGATVAFILVRNYLFFFLFS